MPFKKSVKAGVLLYALLMTSLFSLLLGVYVHMQQRDVQQQIAFRKSVTARAMARYTLDRLAQEKKIEWIDPTTPEETLPKEPRSQEEPALPTSPSSEESASSQGDSSETAVSNHAEETQASLSDQQEKEDSKDETDDPPQQEAPKEPAPLKGHIRFREGVCRYEQQEQVLLLEVTLSSGEVYHYPIPMASKSP